MGGSDFPVVHENHHFGASMPAGGSRPLHHKRKLALPKDVEHRSLTTLREKLVKIGAKVVRHGRYGTFQLAGVAIPLPLFAEILRLIDDLRPKAAPTWRPVSSPQYG